MTVIGPPKRTEVLDCFPPISAATIALLQSLSRNPSLAEVAEMVMRDASLAAQVLRSANSARFAGGQEVHDVLRATVRMGQDAIRRLAITLGMRQSLATGPAKALLADLLEHATATAVIAQSLASEQSEWDPPLCYTGGLLSNMGAVGLAAWRPKEFEGIRQASQSAGFATTEWEIGRFGISRKTVGEWLAAEWDLPQEFRAVMTRESQRDRCIEDLVALVDVAGEIASAYGLGLETPVDPPSPHEVLAQWGLGLGVAARLPASAEELLELPVV